MQAPSQYARPPGHAQLPALQRAPSPHTTPQAPQFKSSAVRSTHDSRPQSENPHGQQMGYGQAQGVGEQEQAGNGHGTPTQTPAVHTNGTGVAAMGPPLLKAGSRFPWGSVAQEVDVKHAWPLQLPASAPVTSPGPPGGLSGGPPGGCMQENPQPPQLLGSLSRFTHAPPHIALCDPGQAQTPSRHTRPGAQLFPQWPHWNGSSERSTHPLPHAVRPALHVATHAPLAQTWPGAQAVVHPPQ